MSILVERASFEDRAKFFHKNQSTIARLLGDLAEPAKKSKRKKKTETKAKEKAKPKAKEKAKAKAKPKTKAKVKAKEKSKAKPKEIPKVEEKNLSVEELVTNTVTETVLQEAPTTETSPLETPTAETSPLETPTAETSPLETPTAEISTTETSSPVETPDDLTKIKGLGAKMVESLNVAEIITFEQLADLTKKQVVQLGKSIRGFASAYEKKDFKKQAQEFNN
jgi:predicted flap endonuclease-1-like 5' DNA nuclease